MIRIFFYNILPSLSLLAGGFSLTAPWITGEEATFAGYHFFNGEYSILYLIAFVLWISGALAVFFLLREIGLIALSLSVICGALWFNLNVDVISGKIEPGIYSWAFSYIILMPTLVYLIIDTLKKIKEESVD